MIAFRDNSSAIRGYPIRTIVPARPGEPSPFVASDLDYHVIFTAETHNFPSGVAPFPGAETGTGGRIRDVHATGRGSLVVAGTAAYCVGNLRIPGYELPWESPEFAYPPNLAPPLQIEIEASNGASDYGNKFGEPVIQGYTRSFGLRLPDGERREWIKPIMFTGGVGQIDARHVEKGRPEKGMWVVKIGGPAYRIGMGGGAASSMVQGENVAELDFNAVQRGDAEMEQKVNRVIRACAELGDRNPIVSIHDQGAGGNCNVLEGDRRAGGSQHRGPGDPRSATTRCRCSRSGAPSTRSRMPCCCGPSTPTCSAPCASGRRSPSPSSDGSPGTAGSSSTTKLDDSTPVDLDLDMVLGHMPQKTFELDRTAPKLEPLSLPDGLTVKEALERVLRLLSVGSKRFLTTKVDRSVTGLIAQQQCVGPLQLTVADVAVDRAEPLRHHRCGHRHRRAADQGAGRSRRHGAHDRGRGPHQPGLGAGERPRGRQVLGELDVGRQAPRGGRRPLRSRRGRPRPHARARHRHRRRQGQPLDGRPRPGQSGARTRPSRPPAPSSSLPT